MDPDIFFQSISTDQKKRFNLIRLAIGIEGKKLELLKYYEQLQETSNFCKKYRLCNSNCYDNIDESLLGENQLKQLRRCLHRCKKKKELFNNELWSIDFLLRDKLFTGFRKCAVQFNKELEAFGNYYRSIFT